MKNTVFFWRNNFLRLWLGIFAVAACFVFGGCEFDQPISSAPNAQIDEYLIGEWKNPRNHSVKISKTDAEHYQISYDGDPFLVAYHYDFGSQRFICGKNVSKPKYMFFSYTLENNNQRMRLKTVGYDVIKSDKASSSEIQKIIAANLQNPKLFTDEEIFERTSPPVSAAANMTNNPPTMKSGRFVSGDTEIYYEVYGAEKKGTPLVLLHGGPGFDHRYFLSNSAFTDLAKNRPVVMYDQRGCGESAKLGDEQIATLDNNLEDLLRLTKFLGYEKIDLAGHSWGGFLAMAYAVIFPKQISHLIIIDSMPENYDDYGKYENFDNAFPKESKEMSRLRMEALFKSDAKAMKASIVEYMKMLFHSPQNRDRFIAGSDKYTYDSHTNSTVNSSAEGVDLTSDLSKSSIPTLILHGRFDENIGFASAEEIRNTIPGSQLVIFEQSGHMPFYEEKEKFVKTVEGFLAK